MLFQNDSQVPVILTVNGVSTQIESGDATEIACGSNPCIRLQHNYQSTSLSSKEIAKDSMNDSLLSVIYSGNLPPYFQVVVNSVYQLECSPHTTVNIQRERIRPTYACKYDRFFPQVSEGLVHEVSHTFSEREAFTRLYKAAVGRENRKAVKLLIIIAVILSLPLWILVLLSNIIAGLILVAIETAVLVGAWFAGCWLADLISGVDYKIVLSDFESNKIVKHYANMKQDRPTDIQYG